MTWFDVDKSGLAAILERRGKAFALFELVQNAWDSGSDRVEITLEPMAGEPYARLKVEDWGEGFADLDEAFTMFRRSRRAGDADKRGRFSLGEKMVLALCREASIQSTSGGLHFTQSGRTRHKPTREVGTAIRTEIRMTRDEYADVCEQVKRLIPPVQTTFNGKELDRPDSLAVFAVKLPTEIADDDGLLRRTVRMTTVEVYEGFDGKGEILEMGVPVVETDNGYRVNVLQKVPLNMDRDNVTPAFLRAINVAVLNELHGALSPEQASAPWAQEAAGDSRATADTVKSVVAKRFGERAVVATPNDPMANANAAAAGFTVIPGGAMSGDLWGNVRKHGLLTPASAAFPTPKPEDLEKAAKMREGKCPFCGRGD